MKIIDISQEVFSCKVYPDDPAPELKKLLRMEEGGLYNLSAFSMCAHNGTHVDAPFHFYKDGKTIDEIALERFVGKCYLARHEGDVTKEDALNILEKAKAEGANDSWKRVLIAGKATVTAEAAQVFADAGIYLIGNESQTIGPENAPMQVHLILLKAEVVLLEGIVLNDLPEGLYFLNAAPLNLAGTDGAPCRAWLLQDKS